MQIVCIIPARLASTRFPRKVLAKIGGKTMLEYVWRAAIRCPEFSEVYIAVDSEEVADEVTRFGGKWHMTSPSCPTGTHRLIEFLETSKVAGDLFVNWQADNPLVSPVMIRDLLQGVAKPLEQIWTLKKEAQPEEVLNPNIVKVVTDLHGRALYFSRSPIPFDRDKTGVKIYKHIGLYAYTRGALANIRDLSITPLSEVEKLEQLTFLEHGLPIHVYHTDLESLGVDTHQDFLKASLALSP